MRVLLIHQAFASPDEPGGTRHYELARYCMERGHRFTIVAGSLSYLSGEPFSKEKGLVSDQDVDGIRVLRAYIYPSLHRSFFWRVVSFISFMFTSIWAALQVGRVDVVMGTSPPIFQAVSAWVISAIRRRPFLLEIRDLWPEFAIDMGVLKNPVLIALSRWLERFLYARATHLLVNSPAYRDYLLGKGLPATKITLVPNGVDPEMFDPAARGEEVRRSLGLDEKFVVAYAGALGQANDIATLLEAADRLRHEPGIHFLLVGDGKERTNLEGLAKQKELPNVTFTGSMPKSHMPNILAASDACVAILKDIPMFRTTYPNKVFDYMAAGRPTILLIDGVIRQVVESAGGGVFVPPGDGAALAESVRELSRDSLRAERMGVAAREYITRRFNRRDQAEQFVNLLQRLAYSNRGGRTSGHGGRSKVGLSSKVSSENSRNGGHKVGGPFYKYMGKRLLDLSIAIPSTILLAPLMLLLAVLVRLRLGAPVLFRQQRPGLRGKPFTILKFRTMTDAHDPMGRLLSDAARMTPLGAFLRRTSLDELPELINVLRGEMSIVGPRPLLMQYLELYTPRQMRRHEVRPGITGWAQVNGRNAISWEEKFTLDVRYVDRLSLTLDLRILALTAWKIARREGISQEGHATMPQFLGATQSVKPRV